MSEKRDVTARGLSRGQVLKQAARLESEARRLRVLAKTLSKPCECGYDHEDYCGGIDICRRVPR